MIGVTGKGNKKYQILSCPTEEEPAQEAVFEKERKEVLLQRGGNETNTPLLVSVRIWRYAVREWVN